MESGCGHELNVPKGAKLEPELEGRISVPVPPVGLDTMPRSSGWQVVIQVKSRRLDALRTQEDGHLGGVAHLMKHHVPQ